MATKTKILCFAGSLKKDSFNKKLVKIAMAGARDAGAEVTFIDLKDYPLPVYDGDIEAASGLPENAVKLKEIFLEHQGLLMACPEYNSSVSAAWKNAIDWVSRPLPGEAPLKCFSGKVAAIMSASPGLLGGLRGLVHVRAIMENIQTMVITEQVAVSQAASAFSEDGEKLNDEKKDAAVRKLGEKLTMVCSKLNG
jgi:chromate reductase